MERIRALTCVLVLIAAVPAMAADHGGDNRVVDLSAPIARFLPSNVAPGASLSTHAPAEPDATVYVGPMVFRGAQARGMHHALKALPAHVRKSLSGRVGPWGMTAQSIGNSWSAGAGLYARF